MTLPLFSIPLSFLFGETRDAASQKSSSSNPPPPSSLFSLVSVSHVCAILKGEGGKEGKRGGEFEK